MKMETEKRQKHFQSLRKQEIKDYQTGRNNWEKQMETNSNLIIFPYYYYSQPLIVFFFFLS